jgi:hypothetical protein
MKTDEVRASGSSGTRTRPSWWFQIVLIVVFYVLYSSTRNIFGSATVDKGQEPVHAFDNAMRIIRWERWLHIFHEATIQSWFLGWGWFIRFWNIYYGTFHFVVTIGAFVWMYFRLPDRFTKWRNVLGATTGLAILGFSLFPLMPPRLVNNDTRYGGERIAQERHIEDFGFVDTLEKDGGLWSFDSGTVANISNQYAAMPSLHIGWSTWCALVMWPLVRRWWSRALLVLYPVATLFCIVVTANHYFLDAVGGLLCLGVGYVIGTLLDTWWREHRPRRHKLAGASAPVASGPAAAPVASTASGDPGGSTTAAGSGGTTVPLT